MSQKIDIRERRYNGVDYDTLHPETNINMVLDSSNNSVGSVNGALYGDGNGNIVGASISNPNLLDNSWFTVNQRGATSGTTDTYIADRWVATYGLGGVTWSRTDDTITIQSTTGLDLAYLEQKMGEKLYNSLGGKTVTLSVMLGDYSIISGTTANFRLDTSFAIELDVDAQGNRTFCTFYNNTKLLSIAHEKTPITIRAVKLELGSVSTLANDVAPNYELELYKCKAYFQRIFIASSSRVVTLGFCETVTVGNVALNLSAPLRTIDNVTFSYSGSFSLYNGVTNKPITNITKIMNTPDNVTLICTATNLTPGTVITLVTNTDGNYIDLSADL